MFKTAKFQIRQGRYQPNLTFAVMILALMDTGGYGVGGFEIWRLRGGGQFLKASACVTRSAVITMLTSLTDDLHNDSLVVPTTKVTLHDILSRNYLIKRIPTYSRTLIQSLPSHHAHREGSGSLPARFGLSTGLPRRNSKSRFHASPATRKKSTMSRFSNRYE